MKLKPLLCAAVIATAAVGLSGATHSQAIPDGYFRGDDGCLHRTPKAVLKGFPKREDCVSPTSSKKPPPSYTTATPNQVIAALECDFSAAARQSVGKSADLSRAIISGTLTFSLVTKNSAGVSLAVGAIPVFASGSLTPSLEASRLTETTNSDEYQFTVDAGALAPCLEPSTNNWLASKVIVNDTLKSGININKITTVVTFVLTKQKSAGLKLNVVPVSIGPQISEGSTNTQKLSLTFDFTKKGSSPSPKSASPATKTTAPTVKSSPAPTK